MSPQPPSAAGFPSALAATARDFAAARTPPGRIFHDADIYARDLREIFGRLWLCVGHTSRAAKPGDYFTVDIGDESLLVVRDRDTCLRAFFNVCRHRGTRLTAERHGHCHGFTCPYHAWHYGLDGTLAAAPFMDDVAGFRREDYPLVQAQIDEWCGFVFVNMATEAQPLDKQFDDVPDLTRYRFETLVCVANHRYDVATNWKLICQNYHECYHCRVAHPDLHRISYHGELTQADVAGRSFIGGPMQLRDACNTLTKSGQTPRRPLPGATPTDQRLVHYFHLLPNFLLSVAPDYVLTHYIWPRGPERVFIESQWFFAPEQIASDDFDPADAVEFWDTTNKQDWALCENALKGLKSAQHRPGPYQADERCAHRFDRWYVQTMFPDTR